MDNQLQISLAAARVNANMTQIDAAEAMQVTKQTIINWEKGKVIPRIPELEKLARTYNIPVDNIFLPYDSTKSREQREKIMDITEINLLDEVYYLKICMKLNASDWYELQNSKEWKAVIEFVTQREKRENQTTQKEQEDLQENLKQELLHQKYSHRHAQQFLHKH